MDMNDVAGGAGACFSMVYGSTNSWGLLTRGTRQCFGGLQVLQRAFVVCGEKRIEFEQPLSALMEMPAQHSGK
jgi:hypothetical protein